MACAAILGAAVRGAVGSVAGRGALGQPFPEGCGPQAGLRARLQFLRLAARRTWRFFETFVTAADHMLPPDNFQEEPKPVIAHRTSPTNLGLYLLSVIAARDFGWLGTLDSGGTPGSNP